ncbi:MAG: glycerophosphodiester phosphodiesterase [Actinomycetota bacterium]|nr:glycerophosphodiester phosphodiesterase [Actinomycetota bacterium]
MPKTRTWEFLHPGGPYGFAHRGGDERAPENTMAAFQHAVDEGFRYLETDVHLTRDGVLVAFHDVGLERVAGLRGAIADYTWAELERVDLGAGHGIPRLEDLFAAFPTARFNIEPKSDAAVAPLAGIVLARSLVPQVCIGSFKDARIDTARRLLGPELCTSPGPVALARLAARSVTAAGRRRPTDFGAVQIPPRFGKARLTAAQVDRYHDMGLQVHVWTINDEAEMQRLFDLGVDAVVSDKVVVLKAVLSGRGHWP